MYSDYTNTSVTDLFIQSREEEGSRINGGKDGKRDRARGPMVVMSRRAAVAVQWME